MSTTNVTVAVDQNVNDLMQQVISLITVLKGQGALGALLSEVTKLQQAVVDIQALPAEVKANLPACLEAVAVNAPLLVKALLG